MRKVIFTILIFVITINTYSQDIKVNETVYTVKGDKIYKENIDVTAQLGFEEQEKITTALKDKKHLIKEEKAVLKSQRKAEKEHKRAIKKRKQAERDLKRKQKAQNNFEKSQYNFKRASSRHERLKAKGKLSPRAESKWQNRLERLSYKLNKAERKLKYS